MIIELVNGRLLDCISDSPLEDTNIIIEDGVIRVSATIMQMS